MENGVWIPDPKTGKKIAGIWKDGKMVPIDPAPQAADDKPPTKKAKG